MLNIDDLLSHETDEMDELFRTAFENMEKAIQSVNRIRPGAGIRTPTPAAEENARGLVLPKGEGSCEVRVPWGLDSPGLPLYFTTNNTRDSYRQMENYA